MIPGVVTAGRRRAPDLLGELDAFSFVGEGADVVIVACACRRASLDLQVCRQRGWGKVSSLSMMSAASCGNLVRLPPGFLLLVEGSISLSCTTAGSQEGLSRDGWWPSSVRKARGTGTGHRVEPRFSLRIPCFGATTRKRRRICDISASATPSLSAGIPCSKSVT